MAGLPVPLMGLAARHLAAPSPRRRARLLAAAMALVVVADRSSWKSPSIRAWAVGGALSASSRSALLGPDADLVDSLAVGTLAYLMGFAATHVAVREWREWRLRRLVKGFDPAGAAGGLVLAALTAAVLVPDRGVDRMSVRFAFDALVRDWDAPARTEIHRFEGRLGAGRALGSESSVTREEAFDDFEVLAQAQMFAPRNLASTLPADWTTTTSRALAWGRAVADAFRGVGVEQRASAGDLFVALDAKVASDGTVPLFDVAGPRLLAL